MGQVVALQYPNVEVEYALINRTKKVKLAEVIDLDDIKKELDHVRELKFNKTELHYLRGTNEFQERMFREKYLEHLAKLQLPDYYLKEKDGNIELRFGGLWADAIYWETIGLAVINELYYRALMRNLRPFEKDLVIAEGQKRLARKMEVLRQYPDITFCDFGTRRRFSREWQDYVIRVMAEEMPKQFVGTSNTYLAMKYGLTPIGTSAHEMYMVMAGIAGNNDEQIRKSHNRVIADWWNIYGWGLSIALTDTFGTDFFFRDMTEKQALNWKGLRQDSGDPMEFGEKAIKFYEQNGIDPKGKMIVFSDGLDEEAIVKIADRFRGRIRFTFGWGTNLTNDLGYAAVSLVVKTVKANGKDLVKLSDNLAKAIGEPAEVEKYKRIFVYNGNEYKECRY